MTGYRITLGYTHDRPDRRASWAALQSIVDHFRRNTHLIGEEAVRLGCPANGDRDGLGEYLAGYLPDSDDMTIRVGPPYPDTSPDQNEAAEMAIWQAASGGEPGRSVKCHLRRAFVRLVMESAHRRGIEVNVIVS